MGQKEQHQVGSATPERRLDPRTKTNHTVLIKTPDSLPIEACVLDVSSRGARLRASEPVPVGTTVRIDSEELLLFGTTTRCELAGGGYDVGVSLSRRLEMLDDLRKLNSSLLDDWEPDSNHRNEQ